MKALTRVLAASLSVLVASQPAFAQFARAVVPSVPVSAGMDGAAGAAIRLAPAGNLSASLSALPTAPSAMSVLPQTPVLLPSMAGAAASVSPSAPASV
ncbi:MAG: hypothetical protein KGL53_11910, partial [Elusimicrobia bacterium]|nr:hypothetical protein [Elusimicrobiota bacterium]